MSFSGIQMPAVLTTTIVRSINPNHKQFTRRAQENMRKMSFQLIALFAVVFIMLHYFLHEQSEVVKALVISLICGLFGYFQTNRKSRSRTNESGVD